MESRLYVCLRCGKNVKSINGLTKYVNVCKIQIILLYYQPLKLTLILENNMNNCPNLPSDNNKENISPKESNYGKEEIKSTGNNNEDIRLANIDQ